MKLLAFLLALVPTLSLAGTVKLTWTPPTQNVDGSALTDLAGYRVRYGTSAADLNQVLAVTEAAASSATLDNLAAGDWFFAVRAVNAAGVESADSNTVSKTITAPAGLTPLSPTAYSVIKTQDESQALVMLPVGTVRTDATCRADVAITVGGSRYNAVALADVTLTGTAKPVVVFAICH